MAPKSGHRFPATATFPGLFLPATPISGDAGGFNGGSVTTNVSPASRAESGGSRSSGGLEMTRFGRMQIGDVQPAAVLPGSRSLPLTTRSGQLGILLPRSKSAPLLIRRPDPQDQEHSAQQQDRQEQEQSAQQKDQQQLGPAVLVRLHQEPLAQAVPRRVYSLVVVGGLAVGYSLAFAGGLPSMSYFLLEFSTPLYQAIKHSPLTDFCSFIDHGLIRSDFGSMFLWVSHFVGNRWGRRLTLIVGGLSWLVGGAVCLGFPSGKRVFIGMAFLGVASGSTLQV